MGPIIRFFIQMLLVVLLITLFFSCKTHKAGCDAYGQVKQIKNTACK
jgi:hypothetical protein